MILTPFKSNVDGKGQFAYKYQLEGKVVNDFYLIECYSEQWQLTDLVGCYIPSVGWIKTLRFGDNMASILGEFLAVNAGHDEVHALQYDAIYEFSPDLMRELNILLRTSTEAEVRLWLSFIITDKERVQCQHTST